MFPAREHGSAIRVLVVEDKIDSEGVSQVLKRHAFTAMAVVAAVAVSAAPAAGQSSGWAIKRSAAADLWFHGLAVIGFEAGPTVRAYAAGYAEAISKAKQAKGVYPTPLDQEIEDLREDLAEDRAFQVFHFLPLYFPDAEPEEFLRALRAVADKETRDPDKVNRVTRPGVAVVSRTIRSGGQRGRLKKLVELLEDEWEVFYAEYWEESVSSNRAVINNSRRQWMADFEPALEVVLTSQRMDGGTALVSPVLGPNGRMYDGVPASRSDNVVAVAEPDAANDDLSIPFSMLHEICYAVVADAQRAPGVRASENATSNGAVRCGEKVVESYLPDYVSAFETMYLDLWNREGPTPPTIATAYPVDDGLDRALDKLILPQAVAARAGSGRTRPTNFGWVIRPQPQTDLWYHTLAVLQADQVGPLGMYSAEYATYIREVKRQRGVYPTPLDSMDADVREQLMKSDPGGTDVFHFLPLYFSRSEPEELMEVLMAVADRDIGRVHVNSEEAEYGMQVLSFALSSGSDRRLLRKLVEAMRSEWELFYEDWWDEWYEERRDQYDAVQELWDKTIAPPLGPFLERERLSGGLAMPSPGLGPEGRIDSRDEFDPSDQVVAMMFPLSEESPDATTFAFLKELCFIIIDPETLRGYARDVESQQDLLRRAAVRCGGMLLEFYVPVLASRYRRAFLKSVGAEESSTQGAFERVFYLEPEIVERMKQEIRRRR
jgi:hypothetical protein